MISSITSAKRKLNLPFFGLTRLPSTFKYSVGSGTLRSPGPIHSPMMPGPMMSEMNSISFAVPDEHHRTGTASPIDFLHEMTLSRRELDFVLRNSRRPQQPHDVGFSRFTDSGENLRCALSEVSGRRRHFPFLAKRAGKHFDLRADAAAIVVEPLKSQPQGTPPVAAVIAKQHGRTAVLCHEEIAVAIAVRIRSNQGAGPHQLK